ncbi:MAG: HlyD family efflux transporter periplasmic adaptor subunit [Polyangiaceae bacterium]
MIKNCRSVVWLVLAGTLAFGGAGCQPKPKHPGTFQGVVEFDERDLGFEIGGRLTAVKVQRGSVVVAGQELATLDDRLERTAVEGRQAEASAARAAVAVVRAGSRPEEVRAMQAQIRAAQANEARIQQSVTREKKLLQEGAIARAGVDDLENRLNAAIAERQSLEHRLRELEAGARKQEIERAEAQAAVADQQTKLGEERVTRYGLRAAQSGVVVDVHADPGEVVAAGAPVCTVADTKHPYADVFVPQEGLGDLKVGTPAKVEIDARPQAFSARIEDVGRRTEFTPRYIFSERERSQLVVRVRVRIDDPDEALHAGVPAFVTFGEPLPRALSSVSAP